MCTSFIGRGDDILVAMNFDNNGMPFSISTKDPKQFVVIVDSQRGKYPSFGVNSEGTFINNLCVDSNGKGMYKRASKKVTHTSRFTGDILDGTISKDKISEYLKNMEVVNGPDFSVHNMIADKGGEVWIVEPGRGVIYNKKEEAPYYVMTNFSLCDMQESGVVKGDGAERYKTAVDMLEKNPNIDVKMAFNILEAVKQSDGEWVTVLSMVYSQKENTVYYCLDRDFNNISRQVLVD